MLVIATVAGGQRCVRGRGKVTETNTSSRADGLTSLVSTMLMQRASGTSGTKRTFRNSLASCRTIVSTQYRRIDAGDMHNGNIIKPSLRTNPRIIILP